MALLKNRTFAVCLTLVICAAALLIGIGRSTSKQIAATRELFDTGVMGSESYRLPSGAQQLESRSNAALGLLSLSAELPEAEGASQSLRQAREELLAAKSLGDKAAANKKLTEACNGLLAQLKEAGLSDNQQAALESYESTLDNAQRLLDSCGYNEACRALEEDVLKHFPVRLLSLLGFNPRVEHFEVPA